MIRNNLLLSKICHLLAFVLFYCVCEKCMVGARPNLCFGVVKKRIQDGCHHKAACEHSKYCSGRMTQCKMGRFLSTALVCVGVPTLSLPVFAWHPTASVPVCALAQYSVLFCGGAARCLFLLSYDRRLLLLALNSNTVDFDRSTLELSKGGDKNYCYLNNNWKYLKLDISKKVFIPLLHENKNHATAIKAISWYSQPAGYLSLFIYRRQRCRRICTALRISSLLNIGSLFYCKSILFV